MAYVLAGYRTISHVFYVSISAVHATHADNTSEDITSEIMFTIRAAAGNPSECPFATLYLRLEFASHMPKMAIPIIIGAKKRSTTFSHTKNNVRIPSTNAIIALVLSFGFFGPCPRPSFTIVSYLFCLTG